VGASKNKLGEKTGTNGREDSEVQDPILAMSFSIFIFSLLLGSLNRPLFFPLGRLPGLNLD